tara:strand:+ start:1015 stop:1629 length:615 start_codon:yes stop_codon:yes gene_type:complete
MAVSKYDSKQVAKILLNINAVKLQPENFFTWSSGKKAPIYCDNRLLLSYPKYREIIIKLLCKYIQKEFQSIDYIAGVATGAIAHGIMVANELDLPFIYVRSNAKQHGRQNQIEGRLAKGSNVVVVEDLISTGKSSVNAIEAINKTGSKVIGLTSIFTYELFDKMDIPYFSICTYSILINEATKKQLISEKEKNILEEWRDQNLL